MRFLTGFACGSVFFLILGAAQEKRASKASRYTDELYGFSIQSPSFPAAAKGSGVTPLIMLGPPENEFSSNVNVMVQETATTRKDYQKLSRDQFKAAQFKVLSEKETTVSKKDAMLIEYEGNQQGRDLRWIALAVITGERVYLVTCTALKGDYPKSEAAFKSCIKSFELTR